MVDKKMRPTLPLAQVMDDRTYAMRRFLNPRAFGDGHGHLRSDSSWTFCWLQPGPIGARRGRAWAKLRGVVRMRAILKELEKRLPPPS